MKKLLSLFGAIGLVATSSATVVACGDNSPAKGFDLEGSTVIRELTFSQADYDSLNSDKVLFAFNKANSLDLDLGTDVAIDVNKAEKAGTIKAVNGSNKVHGEADISFRTEA